jgi:hypothetical protein
LEKAAVAGAGVLRRYAAICIAGSVWNLPSTLWPLLVTPSHGGSAAFCVSRGIHFWNVPEILPMSAMRKLLLPEVLFFADTKHLFRAVHSLQLPKI